MSDACFRSIKVLSVSLLASVLFLGVITPAHAETYGFILKWGSYGSGDGQFYGPHGVAVDASVNVYVADTYNDRVQKFARAHEASTAGDLAPILDTFVTVMESGTTSWDATFLRTPFVLLDGGLYKMWYTATSGGPWPISWVIAYAESSDGIVWSNRQVVHDAGPAYTYYEASWPWVLKEDGVYRMWHMDYNGVDGWTGYIAHMTSTDGVGWPAFMSDDDVKVLNPLGQNNPQGDGYDLRSPCVIHESGGYVMWYSVSDLPHPDGEAPGKVWRTTSTDGIVWSNRQLSLPYIPDTWEGNIQESCVVKEDDGTYTIFYSAGFVDSQFVIGIARSTDGITWTERRQLLRASDLGVNVSFPEYNLPGPFHFEDADGKRYLYFAYLNVSDGKRNIGRIQLGPQPPYDVNIDAYCYAEDAPVSVSITMDGNPTGYNTPHTFTGLTGTHTFSVPNTDAGGHPFQEWSTSATSTTITVNSGGTYTAYYGVKYTLTITTTAGGTTNPSPGTHAYWSGTAVSVGANRFTGYALDHWELDSVNVGTANPISVTMDQDHSLYAVFVYVGGPPGVPEFPGADIPIFAATLAFLAAFYLTLKRKKQPHPKTS